MEVAILKRKILIKSILVLIVVGFILFKYATQPQKRTELFFFAGPTFAVSNGLQQVAFSTGKYGDNKISLISLKTGSVKYVSINNVVQIGDLNYSLNDKKLVLSALSSDDWGQHLILLNIETGTQEHITNGSFNDHDPIFALNENSIYFFRDFRLIRGGFSQRGWDKADFCQVDLKTRRITKLTNYEFGMMDNLVFLGKTNKFLFIARPKFPENANTESIITNDMYSLQNKSLTSSLKRLQTDAKAFDVTADQAHLAFVKFNQELYFTPLKASPKLVKTHLHNVLSVKCAGNQSIIVLLQDGLWLGKLTSVDVSKLTRLITY